MEIESQWPRWTRYQTIWPGRGWATSRGTKPGISSNRASGAQYRLWSRIRSCSSVCRPLIFPTGCKPLSAHWNKWFALQSRAFSLSAEVLFCCQAGVTWWGMKFTELAKSVEQFWEAKPGLFLLVLFGIMVFVFLVVDAWRHKRKRRGPR